MFLLNWWREYKEIRNEYLKDETPCESCITLKLQLAIANDEKKLLLNRLLKEPEPIEVPLEEIKAVLPQRHLSFNSRRRFLEAEDRAKAKIIAQQLNETTNHKSLVNSNQVNVEDLEKELGIASQARKDEAINSRT